MRSAGRVVMLYLGGSDALLQKKIMPYISQERREDLQVELAKTPGELNYLLTTLVIQYLQVHKLSYQTINDILGALEGAKLEFYRRVAVPYEESKILEQGDVY